MPKFTKQLKQTIDKVYKYFKKLGYDDVSIAGMLGNALSESSFNPDSISKSDYHGLWLNSRAIKDAVVGTYGNHSIDSLMKYVDDWVNGSNVVKNGKHSAHLATNHSKFKKTGYSNARDASDAFMRLYERPVILDKSGKIIGYLKAGERAANAVAMYDYINSEYNGVPSIIELRKPDGSKVMRFSYSDGEKRIQLKPVRVTEHNIVYPPAASSPEYLNPYNNADSPAYGGTNPRIQGIQEIDTKNRLELNRVLPDTVVTGNVPSPFSPPTLAELMSEGKAKWVKDITGAPSIYDDQSSNPTINKFLIPTLYANKGKDLPKLAGGKDSKQVERGGITYNVDPSAVEALKNIPDDLIKLNVEVPNTTVRSTPGMLQAREIRNENARKMAERFLAQHPFGPNTAPIEPGLMLTHPEFDAIMLARAAAQFGTKSIINLDNTFGDGNWEYITEDLLKNNKRLAQSLEMYKNPKSAGVYSRRHGMLYGDLKDDRIASGIKSVAKFYDSPEYRTRVLYRVKDYTKLDVDNLIKQQLDNINNARVSENLPYMISEENGHYIYNPNHSVLGQTYGNRLKVTNVGKKLKKEISQHEGAHLTQDFPIIENTNKPFIATPIKRSKYLSKPPEQRARAHTGLMQMQKLGLPINDERAIQNYLGLDRSELPQNTLDLLDNFKYNDVLNMHKYLIGIPPSVILYDINDYNKGKDIYIKPSKRGTFTAAAKRHGLSVQGFASKVLANPGKYSKAMRKKALFARNSKKWSKK